MIYHLSLQTVGLIAGAFLILDRIARIVTTGSLPLCRNDFRAHALAGVILLTVDLVWSFWLLATMEMGEFASFSTAAAHCIADWLRACAAFR